MKLLSKQNLNKHSLRYTIKLNNLFCGTVFYPDGKELKIGDVVYANFVDTFENNMKRRGIIEKILKVESYDSGIYEECDITD